MANRGDGSASHRIEGDHTGRHERQDDERCTTLPRAVSPCDHDRGASRQQCGGEDHTAGTRKAKPLTEPSPVAAESSHRRQC